MGDAPNAWFIGKLPLKWMMAGGTPHFGRPHYVFMGFHKPLSKEMIIPPDMWNMTVGLYGSILV